MKHKIIALALLLGMTQIQGCCFSGCPDDIGGEPIFESQYEPIYLERSVFEQSIAKESARPIENSGKIYVFGDLLFVNEKYKGFHIFSNTDPSNPQAVAFLKIPGVTDMAIRNNVYFFNQAVDLVAVDFNPLTTTPPAVTKRVIETFPPIQSPDGFLPYDIPENNIVVGWQLRN